VNRRSVNSPGHIFCDEIFSRAFAQVIGAAFEDDDLQALVVSQVDLRGGAHAVAQLVLQLGQVFAEIAGVVVLDQGERRHRLGALGSAGAAHPGAGQVAQQLGPVAAALGEQGVQRAQQ
jgi:hypothetical protein